MLIFGGNKGMLKFKNSMIFTSDVTDFSKSTLEPQQTQMREADFFQQNNWFSFSQKSNNYMCIAGKVALHLFDTGKKEWVVSRKALGHGAFK